MKVKHGRHMVLYTQHPATSYSLRIISFTQNFDVKNFLYPPLKVHKRETSVLAPN
jgi:hypothetical protein